MKMNSIVLLVLAAAVSTTALAQGPLLPAEEAVALRLLAPTIERSIVLEEDGGAAASLRKITPRLGATLSADLAGLSERLEFVGGVQVGEGILAPEVKAIEIRATPEFFKPVAEAGFNRATENEVFFRPSGEALTRAEQRSAGAIIADAAQEGGLLGAGEADAFYGVTERQFGTNSAKWFSNEQGQVVRVEAQLRETFLGLERDYNETSAQALAAKKGIDGDVGGHIVGHRFMGNQGEINLFAQEKHFNNSAYRTMENEWADWTKSGGQVNVTWQLRGPPERPSELLVEYKVVDASTGDVLYDPGIMTFLNSAGQTFDRMFVANINALRD